MRRVLFSVCLVLAALAWTKTSQAQSQPASRVLGRHGDMVCALAFAQEKGLVISASFDRTVALWNIQTGAKRLLMRYPLYQNGCALALSEDESRVWVGGSGAISVWKISPIALERTLLRAQSLYSNGLAISPTQATLVATDPGNRLRFWTTLSGAPTVLASTETPLGVVFGHQGRLVATRMRGHIVVFDAQSMSVLQSIRSGIGVVDPAEAPYGLAFGPEDKTVLWARSVARDHTHVFNEIVVVEVSSGTILRKLSLPGFPQSLVSSRDGTRVAVGLSSGEIVVLDVETGALLNQFEGHSERVNALAFSKDGHWLVSGSGAGAHHGMPGKDNTVRLWELK